MSDQDEIAKLLAEANAEAEAAPAPEIAEAPVAPAPRRAPPRIVGRNSDILGVAWLNGSLHAAAFRRQKMTHSWSCGTPVRTVAEFEVVIDEALAKLEFAGTEMFLVLENELFSHQTESTPTFSESAGRAYLKGRIQRYQQEHEPVLWVSQPTVAMKQEQSLILHLLPNSFYDQLNRVLLTRHLDLTRILPMVVPLQYELNKIPAGKNTPVIVVAELGASTAVVVGRVGGPLLFSRTILADLVREPGRVGVEINRSLLYAKQQFECAVDRIWLMAASGQTSPELQAKCGSGKKITGLPTTPVDWLQTTIKISPQHPVNLLAGYLKTKRRNRLIRGALLAVGWLGLTLMILNLMQDASAWQAESSRLADLTGRGAALRAQKHSLTLRNATVERDQAFINEVEGGRLPPVPGRLLGFIAGTLPTGTRLTDFSVKWEDETSNWSFRIDGTIEADEETARELITGFQTQLAKSPLRARFTENARLLAATPTNPSSPSEVQRFSLEGVVLEK
jgi:hypothetical protein